MSITLTGMEKAAVLLKSLPVEVMEKVFTHMPARHTSIIRAELEKVGKRADLRELQDFVFDETMKALLHPPKLEAKQAPVAATAKVDIRVEDKAATDAPTILKMKPAEDANLLQLQGLTLQPPELLAMALAAESARTISLLMNRMEIEAAGDIYKRLPPAKRKEVSMRFATQPSVSDELFKRIVQGVLDKCKELSQSSSAAVTGDGGPEKRMAALLRGLEREERTETLAALEASNAELAARIKAMLYVFEDILRMEKASVQKLLGEVDMKSLAMALGTAAPDIQARINSNLSKRAQESLKEEIELSGNVPPAKSRAAQAAIVEAIQRLDQRGELNMME